MRGLLNITIAIFACASYEECQGLDNDEIFARLVEHALEYPKAFNFLYEAYLDEPNVPGCKRCGDD